MFNSLFGGLIHCHSLNDFPAHSWYCYQEGERDIVYSPDSQTIAITRSRRGPLELWDIDAEAPLHPFETSNQTILAVAFAPDGKTIATSSIDEDFNKSTIRIWDRQSYTLLHELRGHQYQIWVTYSPDSKTLLASGYNPTPQLWDIQSDKQLHLLLGHTDIIYSSAFAPDGKTVLTGGKDGAARLWHIPTGPL